MPTLDWMSPSWGPGNATYMGMIMPDEVNPSSLVRKIAVEAAAGRAVS